MNTEHNGAKNGGGHWGTRAEAKSVSAKARRGDDKRTAAERRDDDRLVRYVSPFGSPAYMRRALAESFRVADDRLWMLLSGAGALSDRQRAVGSPRLEALAR